MLETLSNQKHLLWEAQSQSPKKIPSKFVDVCLICNDTFSAVKKKPNLLLDYESSRLYIGFKGRYRTTYTGRQTTQSRMWELSHSFVLVAALHFDVTR